MKQIDFAATVHLTSDELEARDLTFSLPVGPGRGNCGLTAASSFTTPPRIKREAAKIGPATIALVEAIMKAKPHPEQGFRACLGILRLARSYGSARIEAACQPGNDIGATTYGSIKSILQHGLDRAYANDKPPDEPPIQHGNIRGTDYYH